MNKAEESFARQKSRALWMKEGDKNSKYFHGCMKDRINSNKILSLELEDGSNKIFKPAEIHSAAISHFQSLFSSPSGRISVRDIDHLANRFLSPESSAELIKGVTDEEIRAVIFKMNPDKSPGPNGFTAGLFQQMWNVVGADVCNAIKSFFISGRLLKEFNCTAITLIPKSNSPSKMSDYRTISCCNIIYKSISGILAQRMKGLLPQLVSSAQSAFIPGRSIADNILLAQKILRNYHKPTTQPRSIIKVDILKAYDTVDWQFLLGTLSSMGFPSTFTDWVRECVTTPKFSINLNGELVGFFGSSRGLSQGDPISSYLFVLVMEVLSMLIRHKVEQHTSSGQSFQYHWRCSKTKITHLCFTDDLMLFVAGLSKVPKSFTKLSWSSPCYLG